MWPTTCASSDISINKTMVMTPRSVIAWLMKCLTGTVGPITSFVLQVRVLCLGQHSTSAWNLANSIKHFWILECLKFKSNIILENIAVEWTLVQYKVLLLLLLWHYWNTLPMIRINFVDDKISSRSICPTLTNGINLLPPQATTLFEQCSIFSFLLDPTLLTFGNLVHQIELLANSESIQTPFAKPRILTSTVSCWDWPHTYSPFRFVSAQQEK